MGIFMVSNTPKSWINYLQMISDLVILNGAEFFYRLQGLGILFGFQGPLSADFCAAFLLVTSDLQLLRAL